MIGVTFGSLHSYNDFNLILSSKIIGSPSVKTEFVNIPGADGGIDFTEFFGEPKYNNRKLTFNFASKKPYSQQLQQDSTIKNALHGKRVNIVLDSDPNFYYIGRVSVGDWENDKNIGLLQITCDCEPYKYKTAETTVTETIVDSGTITLTNLRRSIVPKVTTNADVLIEWEGHSAAIETGTDIVIPDLILRAGATMITITGSATVSFKYWEGSL